MKIYFVTTNKGKVDWLQTHIDSKKIQIIQKPLQLSEIRSFDCVKVAKEKAKQAFKILKKPLIVEDSGFYIRAQNGFPATQTKFVIDIIGIKGILKLMKGIKNREAKFVSAVTYIDKKQTKTFRGIYKGTIATGILGNKTRGWGDIMRIWKGYGFDKSPSAMNDKEWKEYKRNREKTGPYKKFIDWFCKNM